MNAVHRRGQLWLILAMLVLALLNRAFVPWPDHSWPPSILSALFLSYLTSQVGLVAVWVALADRVFWAVRVVTVLVFGIAMYSCLEVCSSMVFRVFVPVFAGHFFQVVIALSLMRLFGFRLTCTEQAATKSFSERQFSLKKLLLLTSLIAVSLAIGRAVWPAWQFAPAPLFWGDWIEKGRPLAAITLATVAAVLTPRRPLIWGLLSCLLSALVGIALTSRRDVTMLIFVGPGLMQLAAMCVLRWRGWRLIRPKRAAFGPEVVASDSAPAAVGSLPTS